LLRRRKILVLNEYVHLTSQNLKEKIVCSMYLMLSTGETKSQNECYKFTPLPHPDWKHYFTQNCCDLNGIPEALKFRFLIHWNLSLAPWT
jgi:hypothetical protein